MNLNIIGRFEIIEGEFLETKLVLKRLDKNELGRRELEFETKPNKINYEERLNGCAFGGISLKKTSWKIIENGLLKIKVEGERLGSNTFKYVSIYAISNNDAGMIVLGKQEDLLVHIESKSYKNK
jgi:hypothetical protein